MRKNDSSKICQRERVGLGERDVRDEDTKRNKKFQGGLQSRWLQGLMRDGEMVVDGRNDER